MGTNTNTPRIYVTCLASYGEWIDATDADTIWEAIANMLAKFRQPIAERWAIHNYENFGGLHLSEWEDLDKVAELGELIKEHGEAFAAYADNVGIYHATEEDFQKAYCGQYDSELAYAKELFDECHLHWVPKYLQDYIDYNAFAHDVFMGDNYSITGESGCLYVFYHC